MLDIIMALPIKSENQNLINIQIKGVLSQLYSTQQILSKRIEQLELENKMLMGIVDTYLAEKEAHELSQSEVYNF